ncbi:DUF2461 domain-containing protein [Pedobacter hartonius]|uniref:TIGR02453 family protein n=1 Tax=Pedobacter hartonius TaxID=425514 RepID=A0A1H3ZAK9_9SPHI|nr:DUF2461 domain-containing protein [Pedobacter hartonius]SEA20391.1 TIGR02453 family protein [Pedobacter hartonius]
MIKRETLAFLTEIVENNNREWFAQNKDRYEIAKADVLSFVEELIPVLYAVDSEFPIETQAKKCLMRIYRDIRFSKNKNPYKNNYGISFSVKNSHGPEYYLHLQPGKSYFAAGYWMPEAPDLKNIREEIDYNTSEFLEIIKAENFVSLFTLSKEDTLKKAPKGYDPQHPQIDLLKLKSFIATFPISDEELFTPSIVNHLKKAFEGIYPFVQFLKRAVVH